MPVYSIPETRDSGGQCPSLFTIIQFTFALAACCVLIMCFSSTLWVETFIYTEKEQFRLISIGLWRACYYEDVNLPSKATECISIKYKDFTLSVQICQCIAVIMSCLSLIFYVIRMVSSCVNSCCGYTHEKIHYETRKFRIVCSLITLLSLVISLPLYICEAHVEGVRLNPIVKRQEIITPGTTTVSPLNHTAVVSNNGSLPSEDGEADGALDGGIPKLPHYSVFAWALWMEFAALGLTSIAFSMALVKHASKRKEKYSRPNNNNNMRSTRSRSNLPLDLVGSRPRSESQRAFVRQSSVLSIPDTPMSP